MVDKVEAMQKQAIDLWKKTVAQLDEISKSLMKTSGLDKIMFDRAKLMSERDRLFKRLGEETYKLIDQRKIKVPRAIQDIYVRIRNLMDRLIMQKKPAKKKPAKKKAAKRKTTRKRAPARPAA
jgi:hypothetical protein